MTAKEYAIHQQHQFGPNIVPELVAAFEAGYADGQSTILDQLRRGSQSMQAAFVELRTIAALMQVPQ